MKKYNSSMIFFIFLFIILISKSFAEDVNVTIPDGLSIGTATSAYQIEGAWNIDGKGESIWDLIMHNYKIQDNANGDVATDFYHKYKNDIKLLKDIGINHFRFSISWSRIFPTGFETVPNPAGVRFYHNVLDELEKYGIIPFVTIYHWDHPKALNKIGGWLNETMATLFSNYARFIFQEYGNRVKFFSTINEPNVFCQHAYGSKEFPSADQYVCHHNMLKGHALAYHIYDDNYRHKQNGQIGLVIPCSYFYNKCENDIESADIAYEFDCGITAHPIFSKTGDYPEIVKTRIAERSKLKGLNKSRLPTFSKEWIDLIKGSSDYFGLNHYLIKYVEPMSKSQQVDWTNDEGLSYSIDPKWLSESDTWVTVTPEGFGDLLRTIKQKYGNPPVYVLESGISDLNGINDNLRIYYIYSYIKEVLIALKRDACNIKAYTIWSFLDSLEWFSGYRDKFGLVSVDFNDKNLTRTPKKSAIWLKSVLEARVLHPIS